MTTAADVIELATLECEVIEGSLLVSGGEVDSLMGLETIREITLTLQVTGATQLVDLEGLGGLEQVSNLSFESDDNLSSIALPALRSTGGLSVTSLSSAEFIELPLLQSVTGSVLVNGNEALTSIEMDSLESIGTLSVGSNPNLLTLNGLPSLSEAERLFIIENPKLPQCEVDAIAERTEALCSPCTDNDGGAMCD
jgi:hypothetical protein